MMKVSQISGLAFVLSTGASAHEGHEGSVLLRGLSSSESAGDVAGPEDVQEVTGNIHVVLDQIDGNLNVRVFANKSGLDPNLSHEVSQTQTSTSETSTPESEISSNAPDFMSDLSRNGPNPVSVGKVWGEGAGAGQAAMAVVGVSNTIDKLTGYFKESALIKAAAAHDAAIAAGKEAGTGQGCWVGGEGRGVGHPISTCPPWTEKSGLLCYPWCHEEYHGIGPVCWGREDGASKGKSYGRTAGIPMGCPKHLVYSTGMCYDACPSGFQGVGPVCWSTCPKGWSSCGGLFCIDTRNWGSGATNEICSARVLAMVGEVFGVVARGVTSDPRAIVDTVFDTALSAARGQSAFNHQQCADVTDYEPVKVATCPEEEDFVQVWTLGSDVLGNGLTPNQRSGPEAESEKTCAKHCDANDKCLSFSWADVGGDRGHPKDKVCTIYDAAVPTNYHRGADGELRQVMCVSIAKMTKSSRKDNVTCTAGYKLVWGDVAGVSRINGKGATHSIHTECANWCSEELGCVSYEWSPTEKYCNLNTQVKPNAINYKDYLLCQKTDQHEEIEYFANEVRENLPSSESGGWGGSCTCPDGSVHEVGDKFDACGSLNCEGGVSGSCNKSEGAWSNRAVKCGARKTSENTAATTTTARN